MYIKKIKIKNYRNFDDFEMEFQDGLNIIVGANNSGKTGLLKAISMINNPEKISVHDFNKNNIQKFLNTEYKDNPPEIILEYTIEHKISENDTEDESIIKLLQFINMNEIKKSKLSSDDQTIYTLTAVVNMRYSLNSKEKGNYLEEIKTINSDESMYDFLERLIPNYSWYYSNGSSDEVVDKIDAVNIFKIDFIDAERNSDVIYKETKSEIEKFLKKDISISALQELRKTTSTGMKNIIDEVLNKIQSVISDEKNDIGLEYGNVAISQDLRPNTSISNSYIIDVKDTRSNYILPISNNGLGYNNLINIYMLIKLVEIKKGRDFRILCLEEPEAHLHPAMQYKLFKFLKRLDEENNLNQQVIVTTHSPNISAVADLDNMYMLEYVKNEQTIDCRQQSLKKQLENSSEAKNHMSKFLDVTRSDMLFADKIILVEGIAEKLLLPKFMNKCNYSYEDNHISIVEIGGKHFEHFLKLFANNNVVKKVLCITDKDFKWLESNAPKNIQEYKDMIPNHITKLNNTFEGCENIRICSQYEYGITFEDELFLNNIENIDVAITLLKKALPNTLYDYIDENKVCFYKWKCNKNNIPTKSKEKIVTIINDCCKLIKNDIKNSNKYKNLFFGKLFLEYAKNKKGNVALDILVDENLMANIKIPAYIKEGIKWL